MTDIDHAKLIHPVILSGGAGTRLWPLSRPEHPKQFFPLVSERTMIQDTVLRTARGDGNFAAPIIVTSARHETMLLEQMATIEVAPAALLLEPEGRNTAPAIAIAARWIVEQHGDGVMLVMPSDHMIAKPDILLAGAAAAHDLATEGYLVTFGIVPTAPETGFGYIAQGDALDDAGHIRSVDRFIEKPPLTDAVAYLEEGGFYWNSGIFLFSARALLDALSVHCPGVTEASIAAMDQAVVQGASVTPDHAAFAQAPNISIDHAVMERTDRAAVVPVDMGWSDVGSWQAIWAMRTGEAAGNSIHGDGFVHDARGNLVYVEGGPPVAAIGVDNCVIVSTAQGVLVLPRDRCQDVRAAADHFRKRAF
ncbi:mannose-1-phosphate guanylyltransferase [Sphingobium sp. AP49]|uniref:mannose-1-phosphate guanylyltransferase n=1 Tax=Sphingobium sp. AP49 TaxID=1144307 RepID=UPI0002F02CAC|nr:mannose-1-phosphate guanylyltransferase [Sphingobium sp. AP49]WHO39963.1 mannose-1-phosphate guanylyltransferase [Sphingobium sp. AP49]